MLCLKVLKNYKEKKRAERDFKEAMEKYIHLRKKKVYPLFSKGKFQSRQIHQNLVYVCQYPMVSRALVTICVRTKAKTKKKE